MLRDSVAVAVAVMRTRPRAIPLAMITLRKSTHGFPFLSYMSMRLRLTALLAAGAPLLLSLDLIIVRMMHKFFSQNCLYVENC